MLRTLAISAVLIVGMGQANAGGMDAGDAHLRPYAEGEIERIIAEDPTVEDLVRAMLVGDDPERIEVLVDIIAGPDASAPLIVAQR